MTSLHYNWSRGTSIIGAVMALGNGRALLISTGQCHPHISFLPLEPLADTRHFKVSILVGITTLLRGPLDQRAIFVQTEVLAIPGNIDMQMTYNVSADWAGVSLDRGHSFIVFGDGFAKVVREFQARSPIHVPGAQSITVLSPFR